MDWKKWLADHTTDMAGASAVLEPGDTFFLGQASGIPYEWLDYLDEHKEEFHNITFVTNVMNRPTNLVFDEEAFDGGHFRVWTMFNLPHERMCLPMGTIDAGGASYDLADLTAVANNMTGVAAYVCPPDENGWCNLGIYSMSMFRRMADAPTVKKMVGFIDSTGSFPIPGPYDSHYVHVTELDAIVYQDTEFMALPNPDGDPVDEKIASYIFPYINEGDKVQIGFGSLGDALLGNLRAAGTKFEVFSEVAPENAMPLCKEGLITKIVCCSPSTNSEEFMKWAAVDPRIEFRKASLVVDPIEVMKQDNLVAINATFMVDLLGQACSEAQGLSPYTGPGGSFGFLFGALRAKNGRSFLCLHSTYTKNGQLISNILPWLPEGVIVTTTKVFIMYVVTEYGVADVYLKPLRDRIKALLKIAHPDFRQELKDKILTTPLIKEKDFEGYNLFD
jgi:hypothetical protein